MKVRYDNRDKEFSMSVVLQAKNRELSGSLNSRRLRRAGRIPAVLYGREGKAVSIDLDGQEFMNKARNVTESTIVEVQVDGKSVDAFVKDTQRNIMNGKVLHVDFYEIERGKILRAHVSIRLKGNPIGVRNGGILEFPLHDIEVECLPKDLPPRIELDIADLDVNQSLYVKDLTLGENVKVLTPEDNVVVLVKYAKDETPAPAAATAAAPDAAGAAAAAPGAAAAPAEGAAAPAKDAK
jgi:large subunit ribosomal protein L25